MGTPVLDSNMNTLILLLTTVLVSSSARVPRQVSTECSSCTQRLQDTPNLSCCRCQDRGAFCNNDLATPQQPSDTRLTPGLTCPKNVNCMVFGICTEENQNCLVEEDSIKGRSLDVVSLGEVVTLRQAGSGDRTCSSGQVLCCNPVPGSMIQLRIGLITGGDPLGEDSDPPELTMCENDRLSAVVNFDFGVTCGKRDSRVYFEHQRSEAEDGVGEVTNPGEWPWAVLIFDGDSYLASGALVDNDVVVTVATKLAKFADNPEALTVRLGDFDPTNENEEFAHVEMEVVCVRVHPSYDYPNNLAHNVAILKLRVKRSSQLNAPSAASVVTIRSARERPANKPRGVTGSNRNTNKDKDVSSISLRIGLLSDLNNDIDPLGQPVGEPQETFIARTYINTVCLPERQFSPNTRCWVAAWGKGLHEQREVDLPLLSKSECERRLRPEFRSRGVNNWTLASSELCAGGEGKDSCEGEGGAPLVCLDKDTDQYYAVGLVGYGFDCSGSLPAVYTNLMDPDIRNFVDEAISNRNYCEN